MIDSYIQKRKYCSRWVSDNEAKKLTIINDKILIENWIGKLLILINYFVCRRLVYITGEAFIPNYENNTYKYVVLFTWIVFVILVFISAVQLATKSKVYTSDVTLNDRERTYYKYKLFNRTIRVALLTCLYIIFYQILFQMTIPEINIKAAIVWWIVILNVVTLVYLAFINIKSLATNFTVGGMLEEVVEKMDDDNSNAVELINSKRVNDFDIKSMNFEVTFKAIEELLQYAEDQMAVENKSIISKSELITNVSHDLKTPLTSIINYVNFLKREDLTQEQRTDYIEILERKANNLKALLEDLKESTGMENGIINVELEMVSLDKVLDKALLEFKERIEEARLEVIVSLGNNLEHLKESYIDKKKMARVIHNLLSNIIKYSEKNSEVQIIMYQEEAVEFERGYYTRISFKNISENEITLDENELMERFRREDSSRNTEGTGLGLDIARSLMEVQDGELKVKVEDKVFIVDVII